MPRPKVKRYRTGEVAKMLGVARETVISWIHKGKIKAERTPGGHYRIPEYEVKKLKNRKSRRR